MAQPTLLLNLAELPNQAYDVLSFGQHAQDITQDKEGINDFGLRTAFTLCLQRKNTLKLWRCS